MQEVQLDSKIKLLDSPGVVFATRKCQDEGSYALKNAVRVHNIDPLPAATAILQRSTKEQVGTSTPWQHFFYKNNQYETNKPKEYMLVKVIKHNSVDFFNKS